MKLNVFFVIESFPFYIIKNNDRQGIIVYYH